MRRFSPRTLCQRWLTLGHRAGNFVGSLASDGRLPLLAVGAAAVAAATLIRLHELPLPYDPAEWSEVANADRVGGGAWRGLATPLPQLFPLLLRAWELAVGSAPAATAGFSLLWAAVAVWGTARLAALLFGRATAATAAVLLWVSYLGIHFSTASSREMLVVAMGAWSTLGFSRSLAAGSPGGWRHVLPTALGVFIHPAFWFLVIAQAAVVATSALRRRLPASARAWWRWPAALVLLYAPWLPAAVRWVWSWWFDAGWRDASGLPPMPSWQFPASVLHIFLYPTWTATWRTNLAVGAATMAVLATLVLTISYQRNRWLTIRASAPPFATATLLAMIAVPLLLLAAGNVGDFRPVVYLGPLFAVLLAHALERLDQLVRSGLPTILFLTTVTALNLLAVAGWRLPW